MVAPAIHPLVTLSAGAALFTAGAGLGYLCSDSITKIYEYAKCYFGEGTLYRDGDKIVKQFSSLGILDGLCITSCSAALSVLITTFALTLFATTAPVFVASSVIAGAIIAPLVHGAIFIFSGQCGAHRTITMLVTPDKARRTDINSLQQIDWGNQRYIGFPYLCVNEPRDCNYQYD